MKTFYDGCVWPKLFVSKLRMIRRYRICLKES